MSTTAQATNATAKRLLAERQAQIAKVEALVTEHGKAVAKGDRKAAVSLGGKMGSPMGAIARIEVALANLGPDHEVEPYEKPGSEVRRGPTAAECQQQIDALKATIARTPYERTKVNAQRLLEQWEKRLADAS